MSLVNKHGMMVDESHPHLGGFVPGGDPATFYPGLWEWLVSEHDVRSVIDVGCGDGVALRWFREHGCRVLGIDGIPQDDPDIVTRDYTERIPTLSFTDRLGAFSDWDLAWSCEFVEHVEEQHIPNFVATFQCARMVLMTHAEPGQAGWHHVNCQPADYWKGVLSAAGFDFDETLTEAAREMAGMNPDPYNHFKRSGLAFRRR